MFKPIATAVLAVSFAGAAIAQDQTNAQFQSFSPDAQKGYIGNSLIMAQALLSNTQGVCIGKWAKANEPNGYNPIVNLVKKYPDIHPSAIIAAFIEKECGKLELAQR